MKIIESLADLVDRFFERADRVNWRPIRRVAAPVFFALLSAIAALYAVGLWDFTFIKRPEPIPAARVESDGSEDVSPSPDAPSPGDNAPAAPDSPEGGEAEPEADPQGGADASSLGIAQMSDLSADGWYVTSNVFDRSIHRLAVLNVDLGAPADYTLRERNVYRETVVDSSEYVYGEKEVEVEFVAEDRPALEAYGGYIFVDNGESVVIFDCYGKYVTNFDESMYFAYTRDRLGNPLFYTPSSFTVHDAEETMTAVVESKNYYALTRNGVTYSDYKDEIYSRGVHADLPAYYGAQTEPYPRSVVVNTVSYLDLKYKLTGWIRTLWGFSSGYGDPFTKGWYDPEKVREEAEEAEEEYQRAVEEAKEKGEDPPKREKKTAAERFEEAKEAEKLWDETPSKAFNFSEGLACVANEKGQMWFIDHSGNSVIEMKDVEGVNAVGRPVVDNYYLPLTNGMESLGFYYFDHGLCRVRRQSYDKGQDKTYHMLRPEYDDDELIYADGSKFTLAEGYDVISYSNGLILLRTGGEEERYGFMDYTGAWIAQPELEDAKPFVEGLAPVKRGGRWGVIDTAGNTVVPFAYDSIQTTSSGIIVAHYEGGWTVFAKMAKA